EKEKESGDENASGNKENTSDDMTTSITRVTVNDYFMNGAYNYADAHNSIGNIADKQLVVTSQLCKADLAKCIENIRHIETLLLKSPELEVCLFFFLMMQIKLGRQNIGHILKLKIKEIRERADKLRKVNDFENPIQTLEYIKMLTVECLALQEKAEVLLSYLGTGQPNKKKKNGLFGFF
ncbi:hypothetical protein RFI_22666, partial [Reticulomyxa filosa]